MPIASMLIPLSNKQKSTLAIVARKAHVKHGSFEDESFDDWRAREAVEACGKRISEASNGDYNTLLAHFENLAGNARAALDATMRADTDEHRQAMHVIDELLAQGGHKRAYAEKICQSVNRCSLADATPAQLNRLRMTLKKRVR